MTYSKPRVPFDLVQCDTCGAQVLPGSTKLHDQWHTAPCEAISFANDRCVRIGAHGSTEHMATGPTGHAYIWQGTYS